MTIFAGYRITSPYGNRIHPIKKTELFHRGIDLVIGFQKPILSFTDGEVLFAKEGKTGSGFGNYGNIVAVRDKNKVLHCYAHLDRIDVNVGNLVKRGDQLGTEGNTGQSAGSHLHYEIRLKDSPSFGFGTHTDPTEYLNKFYEDELKISEWARDAVAWATRNGFADDQNLKETMTKEQIITILYRISKK
jgi:murein DD-endopeptidase MepM/ murein hydrolase activator NlpD